MGSYQISASSAMADQFLGRGLEEQDLNEDFLKHLLSGTEGFEESLFDPLPVNGGSPGAVPSLPQDDTALLQLLDWTAEQAFSSQALAPQQIPLEPSTGSVPQSLGLHSSPTFHSAPDLATDSQALGLLPHSYSNQQFPQPAPVGSFTPIPQGGEARLAMFNDDDLFGAGNHSDLDLPPRKEPRTSQPRSGTGPEALVRSVQTPISTMSVVGSFRDGSSGSGSATSAVGEASTQPPPLLPPLGGDELGSSGGGKDALPEEVDKHREKNRNAQKRFRARQRERAKDSAAQMEALSAQMGRLMQEKAELETRNRILEQVVKLNVDHVEQLQSHKEVMSIEQSILLEGYAQFVSKVERRPGLTLEDAQHWLMGDLMTHGFQLYINRLRQLYAEGTMDSNSAANQELNDLVTMRREHEKQGAMFSCFYWAVFSWNLEETAKRRTQVPSPAHWGKVLAGLKLSQHQETEILAARKRLLSHLTRIASERTQIVSAIGLELLQVPKEQLFRCQAVADLRKSLQAERDAVFDFLFTAVDDTLTPRQEAFLDVQSYPFCPDIWQMTSLLATKKRQPEMTVPNLDIAGASLADVLPHASAFQVLVSPIAAQGIGLRLKRGLIMCQFHTTSPRAAFPIASQAQLAPMTLLDVHCGRWKALSYYEWQKQCIQRDCLVHNSLTILDTGQQHPGSGLDAFLP